MQEIYSNELSYEDSISSNITGIPSVRDETLYNDDIVILQVRSGYFRTPLQKDAIIGIVSSDSRT